MSVITTKVNGKIDTLQVFGKELDPFLNLLQTLWNECELSTHDEHHARGISTLHLIMKDFQ